MGSSSHSRSRATLYSGTICLLNKGLLYTEQSKGLVSPEEESILVINHLEGYLIEFTQRKVVQLVMEYQTATISFTWKSCPVTGSQRLYSQEKAPSATYMSQVQHDLLNAHDLGGIKQTQN